MTLRGGLIGVCAILVAIAVWLFAIGAAAPGLIVVVIDAGFVLAAVLVERYRYNRPLNAPPGEGWEATGETFIDPGTGEALRVYFQPSTGKRVYVRVERPKASGE